MTAAPDSLPEATPTLLGWPVAGLPLRAKLALALLTAGALTLVGVVASKEHPRDVPRVGSVLERQVAEMFRDPTVDSWDGGLGGDFLVERFYILDVVTGDRYVADLLKGRINGVEVVQREDQSPTNVFLLDTKDMRRDKAFYNAYLKTVSHPERAIPQARYLGAVMPPGDRDAFPVNYTGEIPPARVPFHVGDDDDAYAYMLRQNYKGITEPRGLSVSGYFYVLSTTDLLPVFKTEYKLEKTMFVSELLVVDATTRQNKTLYYKLLEQYPRSVNP